MPDPAAFDTYIQAHARVLRAGDRPPTTLAAWKVRREDLRKRMLQACGSMPDRAGDLSPRIVATLERKGYRIENVLLQSRPGVWVTANTYVPEHSKERRVPAVLV